jgi:hypothetical protein
MTDHNTAELKRQADQSRSKLENARKDYDAADLRLKNAKVADANAEFAARGINIGDKVIAVGRHGGVAYFDGHDCTCSFISVILRKIKKDGTMSAVKLRCSYLSYIQKIEESEQ